MPKLMKRKELWIGFAFVAAFVAIIFALDDKDAVELFNGILFSVAVGVMVTYWPAFWRALGEERKSSSDYLLLGIGISWLSITLHRGLSTVWRAYDKPEWIADHWVWSVFIFLGIIAGTLHITAPHAIDGRVPTWNWIKWGIFVALGTAAAVTFMWWTRS